MYNGQRQVMLLAGHDLSRPGNDHRTVSWDRSRWRDRGRLGRFRDQLHRILHHLLGKLAHVSGNLLIVRFLSGVRGHFASGRTHSHPPAKQGGACLQPIWLAAPSEAKRWVIAQLLLFRKHLNNVEPRGEFRA